MSGIPAHPKELRVGRDCKPWGLIENIPGILLFQEGMHGNSEDYYNSRNHYLFEVPDRKLTIPTALSGIYLKKGLHL